MMKISFPSQCAHSLSIYNDSVVPIKQAASLTISEQFSSLIANFLVINETIFQPDGNFHVIEFRKNPP